MIYHYTHLEHIITNMETITLLLKRSKYHMRSIITCGAMRLRWLNLSLVINKIVLLIKDFIESINYPLVIIFYQGISKI